MCLLDSEIVWTLIPNNSCVYIYYISLVLVLWYWPVHIHDYYLRYVWLMLILGCWSWCNVYALWTSCLCRYRTVLRIPLCMYCTVVYICHWGFCCLSVSCCFNVLNGLKAIFNLVSLNKFVTPLAIGLKYVNVIHFLFSCILGSVFCVLSFCFW